MVDAVTAAIPGQETPRGYYNISRMLKQLLHDGAVIKLCGSCVQARGLNNVALLEGVEVSNLQQLSIWTLERDNALAF